jgi:hypothetical protein
MTLVGSQASGSDPGVIMYQRVTATADGSPHTATFSFSDLITGVGSCTSFTGVDQTTPLGSVVSNNTNDPMFLSITVPTNGMALDLAVSGRGYDCSAPLTVTASGQSSAFWDCGNAGGGGGDTQGMGSTRSTSGTMSWTGAAGAYVAQMAVPINAAAVVTGVARRRIINQ